MIQPLGQGPERLLKQADGNYAMRSSPRTSISFILRDGHAAGMKMDSPAAFNSPAIAWARAIRKHFISSCAEERAWTT